LTFHAVTASSIISPTHAMVASATTYSPPTIWILDFGASFHVTNDSKNIQQLQPFDGPDNIFVGNGEGLLVYAFGSSTLSPLSHPSALFNLHQLLLLQSITTNLLFVHKFS